MTLPNWLFATWPGAFLIAFPSLFSIVDPMGNSIIVSQLTSRWTHAERMKLARKVALYTLLLLMGSLWVGSHFLHFFGVTIGALRIAGGLVIAITGWRLLNEPEQREEAKQGEAEAGGRTETATTSSEIAFFPITVPFTAGPGAIAAEITLGAAEPPGQTIQFMIGTSVATVAVVALVWFLYSYSGTINKVLGQSGSRVLSRLIALIVLAVGVQILGAGIHELLTSNIPEVDL
jgi:multiple antibiotic resistance protein